MSQGDLSRRSWFLRLGGAAMLHEIGPARGVAAEGRPLPPGLYEPSLQHLAHSLNAASRPVTIESAPRYFGAGDFSIIQTLAARILGEEVSHPVIAEIAGWLDLIAGRAAETRAAALALPAAHRRLAVDYYGEEAVRELESEDPQAVCRDGLAALKQNGFAAMDPEAQIAHLAELERAKDRFLIWMKSRTLDGFYTSQQGLQELDYKGNAFYAESPGCDHEKPGQ
jgi:hypothetical protein